MVQRSRNRHTAFTLIELLIVVGIVSLLLAISVVVGAKVVGSGKARVTEGLIKALDMTLQEYAQTEGHIPGPTVADPRDSTKIMPVADAYIAQHPNPAPDLMDEVRLGHINTVGLYMLQVKGTAQIGSMLQGLDAKYVRKYDPDNTTGLTTVTPETQPALLTVFDGWGNPIRYVHPAFKGNIDPAKDTRLLAGELPPDRLYSVTKIRRTGKAPFDTNRPGDPLPPPDADAGIPANNRPYFYSLGADGRAGYEYDQGTYKTTTDFNKDNVFVSTPRYEKIGP